VRLSRPPFGNKVLSAFTYLRIGPGLLAADPPPALLRLFELACVLVRPDHVARIVVNADHGVVGCKNSPHGRRKWL
jgi:hypothetical protein